MDQRTEIIIIGAGASGLAAASKLLENGFNNLIVLEAENRIGGRIHSVDFAGGKIDLGAQWCHGQKNNIVYSLCKDLNLLRSSINHYDDFTFYLSGGRTADKAITDELLAILTFIANDETLAKTFDGTFGDYVTQTFRGKINANYQNEPSVRMIAEMLLHNFHLFNCCLDSATTWHDWTSSGPLKYVHCEGDQYLHWGTRGYATVLELLMKNSLEKKIVLNKQVRKIVWRPENTSDKLPVKIQCSDGTSYSAKTVIVTVSLGVLKTLINRFHPPLPAKKQDAIRHMAIGMSLKIFLDFGTKWWPHNFTGFNFLWSQNDKSAIIKKFPHGPMLNGRSWLEDFLGFYPIDDVPTVLIGWFVGPMVDQVELLPETVVVDGCVALFKYFLKGQYDGAPPVGILRSQWKNNSNFNGAYSYINWEAEKRGISNKDLANPVLDPDGKAVILFAGEATHSEFYGTVHGAIESGFREADRVMALSPRIIHRQVVIVGAGMAGLAAASTLQQFGCDDFMILEAQSRPGGRIQSLEVDGNVFEMGAQWIHGTQNPIYELAKRHNLLSAVTSEEGLGVYVRDNGEQVDEALVKEVDVQVRKILEECERFETMSGHEHEYYPRSVGDFLHERFAEHLAERNESDKEVARLKLELLDWHVRFLLIDNACTNLYELSAKSWGRYLCVDDSAHFNLTCPFSRLVDVLVASLPSDSLQLETATTEIRTSSGKIDVICANNLIIHCEHLILTPSLGALGTVKFTPPLPGAVRKTIKSQGFGAIGKIFLVFERRWWSGNGVQFVWRRGTEEKRWVRYIQGFDAIVHGKNVLLGWVGGEGVRAMEELEEEEVGVQCVEVLRRFIRDREVPAPVKVLRSSWLSNPWVRGSYSHISTVCDRSGSRLAELSEPIYVDGKPRIFIAGEATSPRHYSTVHGAYESGQKQAEVVANYLLKNSKL